MSIRQNREQNLSEEEPNSSLKTKDLAQILNCWRNSLKEELIVWLLGPAKKVAANDIF